MKCTAILLIALLIAPAIAVGGSPASATPDRPSPTGSPAGPTGAPLPLPASEPQPGPFGPAAGPAPGPRSDASNYSDVLLLINNQSAISMQIGSYFKQKRNIPDKNICNISMPTSEWISQSQFQTVRTAIEGWIDSSGLNNTLNYIVTTKGDPLGVWGSGYTYASFMDELSLIDGRYSGSTGNNGWLDNPFAGSEERFSRQKFGLYIVTRLDGYDLNDCLRLVDNAIDSTGARGTFVLDSQPWKDGGGYQEGNDWCREANRTLTEKGWSSYLDDTSWYVVNQKNVSGYASWGSNDGNAGNYAKPGFTWVPGAIGTTYVSTSARSFAYPPSYGQSLIADLVREGITGVHGNVAEPFLGACARPNYFLDRYTRGWNLAESFSAGMATSSWQNCIIGDPKIEPYSTQPDPAIFSSGINLSAAPVVEGMNVNITANVRNIGGGPAHNTTVAFYDGDPAGNGIQIGQNITLDFIAAGGEAVAQVAWDTAGTWVGTHSIYVRLAPSNSSPQLWEGNDLAFRDVMVLARPELVLPRDLFTVSSNSPLEGEGVWFNLTVKNIGGSGATTELRFLLDGSPVHSENQTILSGQALRQTFLWNSAGHPGQHRMTAEAVPVPYEANGSNNNLSANLFVRRYGLELESDSNRRSCLPGGTAEFNITVRSTANSPEEVVLRLSPPPAFWTAVVEPEGASLEPGGASSHRIQVTSPASASAAESWGPSLRCEGLTSGIVREQALVVTVAQVRVLQLSTDPAAATAPPGGNATFKLTLRNLGNGPDTVNLSREAPEGWAVELESSRLELPHHGTASILVKVRPPDAARAGETGTVKLAAASPDGSGSSVSVEVEVEQVYGVEASLGTDSLTLRPGEKADIAIHIRNTGNGVDTFSLILPQTGLTVSAPPGAISLGAFSSQEIKLTVKVPPNFASQKEKLQLGAQNSHGDLSLGTLTVAIVRPDLSLPRTMPGLDPASPVDGDTVNITVEVRNLGTAASGPVNLTLSDRWNVLRDISIPEIEGNGTAVARLAWNATAGDHELTISVKCGFGDPTPGDGSVTFTVRVDPKPVKHAPSPGETGPSLALVAGGIILALAVILVAAAFLSRRRPPAEPETEMQPEGPRPGFSLVGGRRPPDGPG